MSVQPFRLMNRSVTFFGARFPAVAFIVAAGTLAVTIVAVVAERSGLGLASLLALQPSGVMKGEVWRLITWPFVEPAPLSLIFACAVLLFFGRDLCYHWGAARYLKTYLAFAAGTGAAVCLVGLVWPAVWRTGYLTAWPLADALIIAWASAFPSRQILVYFVLPLGGRRLIYATFGINVIFALFAGVSYFVPHFIALTAMWVYQNGGMGGFLGRWRRRGWGQMGPRRRSNLRVIDPRERRDEPPRWLH
ncbi:MAG TPA: rhomboid family intramembrane serine protease [Vicinamibacteria bacterium]